MDRAVAQRFQAQLDTEVAAFKEVTQKLSELVPMRQRYMTQLNENDMVKRELTSLDFNAQVFKLVGPVLVKQDSDDARSNVEGRIKYFKSELERLEKQEKDLIIKRDELQKKIEQIQNAAQNAMREAIAKQTASTTR